MCLLRQWQDKIQLELNRNECMTQERLMMKIVSQLLRPIKAAIFGLLRQIEKQRYIFRVRSARSKKNGIKIVVGSSGIYNDSWIPTDYQYLNLLNDEHWSRIFKPNEIDAILAEHVFEHLTKADGMEALRRLFKYMKQGARLRVAVPDGNSPNKNYIEMVKPGGWGAGSDDHKVLYDVDALEHMFLAAGFIVERLEYFDAKGDFHQTAWQPEDGMVHRSLHHDPRNKDGVLNYTSLILDGVKP